MQESSGRNFLWAHGPAKIAYSFLEEGSSQAENRNLYCGYRINECQHLTKSSESLGDMCGCSIRNRALQRSTLAYRSSQTHPAHHNIESSLVVLVPDQYSNMMSYLQVSCKQTRRSLEISLAARCAGIKSILGTREK